MAKVCRQIKTLRGTLNSVYLRKDPLLIPAQSFERYKYEYKSITPRIGLIVKEDKREEQINCAFFCFLSFQEYENMTKEMNDEEKKLLETIQHDMKTWNEYKLN